MKKLLFAICAVAALASCSKEEVVSYDKGEAIGFANPFVNKATRADYSTNNVNAFKVYGAVTPTGGALEQIYNGVEVTRGNKNYGDAWTYDEQYIQYWQPNSEYEFAAIVDGEAASLTSHLPKTIKFTVADGNENKDLLYATASVITNDTATPSGNGYANNCVAFNFTHLLSKMQFTIENATNQTYKVTDISVTRFTDKGVYEIADDGSNGTWAEDTDAAYNVELTFGETAKIEGGDNDIATETRQFLPLEQTLAVTITYDVYQNDTVIGQLTKTGTIPATTYEKNKLYNVVATLTGNDIKFTVSSVGGWTPSTPDINVQ